MKHTKPLARTRGTRLLLLSRGPHTLDEKKKRKNERRDDRSNESRKIPKNLQRVGMISGNFYEIPGPISGTRLGGRLDARLNFLDARLGGCLDARAIFLDARLGARLDTRMIFLDARLGVRLDTRI